jgi:hypothetical protein
MMTSSFGFRLRLFSLADEIGVRPACRAMRVEHSTYYRWKRRVDRWGLEALRVRSGRRCRTSSDGTSSRGSSPSRSPTPALAQRVLGRARSRALGRAQDLSKRVLARPSPAGLNTRGKRLSLVAGYAARYERAPSQPSPTAACRGVPARRARRARLLLRRSPVGEAGRRLTVHGDRRPRRLRLGVLRTSPRNPRAENCSALVPRVAGALAQAGWRLEAVITDNGSEYRAAAFTDTPSSGSSSGGSAPAAHRRTGRSSACSRRSSRNAGDSPSLGRSSPSCVTSTSTSAHAYPLCSAGRFCRLRMILW